MFFRSLLSFITPVGLTAVGFVSFSAGQIPTADSPASQRSSQDREQIQSRTLGIQPAMAEADFENAIDPESAPCKLTGRFHLQQGTNQGYLVLQCELPPGSYIHSLTQAEELNPTVIRIQPLNGCSVTGPFHPDRPPTVIERDPVFDQRLEKHLGKVQFFVPIQIAEGIDVAELKPQMIFDGQVCSEEGVCVPLNGKLVTASFAGYFERTAENQISSPSTGSK